ncbi:arylsulfatase [Puteibacter caeruleilacunae]|nr:arylsulfatase [Puteibacter caeruleilacunae]
MLTLTTRCLVGSLGLLSVLPAQGYISKSIKQASKPNIILLLADDLGYGDLSCYGSRKIETPQIDKMASEGLQFTQFYAGSAVCTPTRVSIMTGKYPLRYNVGRHFNDKEMYLNNDMPTIPKLLKQAGYISKHVGKWHLGGLNEKHVKNRENSMPGPLQHGFDHYLAMLEDPLYRAPAMLQNRLYKDGAKHLVRDEKIISPIDKHWTDVKTDEALDFINNQANGDHPFFLNLWFDTPHAPYEPTPEESMKPYRARAKGKDLLYRGMVSRLDHSVGRILDKLRKLGIEKNTLVILTSDNGPAYIGSPGMFKGRKVDFHEGGIRVPMIAWWPGQIESGKQTDELGHTTDLLPTFCSAANIDYSSAHADGKNILPLLTEGIPVKDRGYVFWSIDYYGNNGNYGITVDKRPEPVATEIVRKGKWKLLAKEGQPLELFNLEEDPYERWNLYKQYPEIAQDLTVALAKWLKEPRVPKPY